MCHYPSVALPFTSLSFFRVFDGGNAWEASPPGKQAAKDTQINGNPVRSADKRMALSVAVPIGSSESIKGTWPDRAI